MKKILVIRFSSIGDIVLTTPVVRNLHNNGYKVHYLTKTNFKGLLINNPSIHKLHLSKEITNNLLKELLAENFDFIIDLHNNYRSNKVKKYLKNTPSYTVNKQNLNKALLVLTKCKSFKTTHIVSRYLDCIKPICKNIDNKGLDFYPEPATEKIENFTPNTYITFVIGGQHSGKMMRKEKMRELCSLCPYPILLIGGPDDKENGEFVAKGLNDTTNLTGFLNISDSAILIKQSKLVISHDTGFMHIASAFGKDIISLWGATTPELGFSPYKPGKNSIILESKHWLRPTSKLGKQYLSKPINFIDNVKTKDIINSILKIWCKN